MMEGQLQVWAPEATEASIRAAALAAIAAGGGIVMLPNTSVTITQSLPVASGLHYRGYEPILTYATNLADQAWDFIGGTRLVGDGTFAAIDVNTTDLGSPPSPFPSTAITNFSIECVGFDNFSTAIKAGAQNSMSFVYSLFRRLFIKNCAAWGMDLVNFAHIRVTEIWIKDCMHVGRFSGNVAGAVLQCGNWELDQFYGIIPGPGSAKNNILSRGLVIESRNDAHVQGSLDTKRIQINAFNRTPFTQTANLTSGSANITVTDGTKFAVGLPVKFTTTANGFSSSKIYTVLSVASNVITVGLTKNGSAVVASATASMTIGSRGMSLLEMVGYGTATVSSTSLPDLDLESDSSATIWMENANSCDVKIIGPTALNVVDAHVVMRNAGFSKLSSYGGDVIVDADPSSCTTRFEGRLDRWMDQSLNGIYRNAARHTYMLGLTNAGGALEVHNNNGDFFYPTIAMGQRWIEIANGWSLGASDAGVCFYNGGAGSVSLKEIGDGSNPIDSNVGLTLEIFNVSASGSLTVNTSSSQTINGIAAKTSHVIAAGQSARFTAGKVGSTYLWGLSTSNTVS